MGTEAEATPNGTEAGANSQPKPEAGKETTTEKPLTQADISRAVNEAKKEWNKGVESLVADKTKDAESKIAELSTKAAESQRYADFVDRATAAGIKDLRAAYVVATGLGYLKDDKFDEKEFKKNHPQFYTPAPNANAGAGAGGGSTGTTDMNSLIRQAAGVR